MKKFLLALFFTAFALTGVHAQSAQQSPAQPDVKPTILDPVANKRVAEISAQLRCLVCQNQSIADSNAELALDLKKHRGLSFPGLNVRGLNVAELAMDLKKQVVKQIAEGKTNQQIIDFMVDRYGDFVLYNPPFKMSTLLLWLGPILFLVLALGGLFYTMAKRKKLKPVELTAEQKRRAEELLRGKEPAKRRDAK